MFKPGDAAATPMTMVGRRVALRPFTLDDVPLLYSLIIDPVVGRRFRFAGATPRPEEVAHLAWQDVLCQFTAIRKRDDRPVGIVTVYSPDFRNGYASAAVMADPSLWGSALGVEAFALLLEYAFMTWPFRKLYAEALEESLAQFKSSVGRFVEVEGRRKLHQFVDGEYQDVYILAIYRDEWLRVHEALTGYAVRDEQSSTDAGLVQADE
jgi:RimJ/RimL family protein N-acetyltransferase